MKNLKQAAVVLMLISVIALSFSCAETDANETAESSNITTTEIPAETELTRDNYPDGLPDTDLNGAQFRISVTDKYKAMVDNRS